MYTNFQKGIMYGDSSLFLKDGYRVLMFTSTNKEITDHVEYWLKNNGDKLSRFRRDHTSEETKNYEILEIIESYHNPFTDGDEELTFIKDFDFLQGYLQTKGTIFSYIEKRKQDYERYRIAFSGSKEDLEHISEMLISIGINPSTIVQRKERAELGVVSQSYRLPVQSRKDIRTLLSQFKDENWISLRMKEEVENFIKYDSETPSTQPNGAFKHFKGAVKYMLREMDKTSSLVTTRGGEYRIFYNDRGYSDWESLYGIVYSEFNMRYPRNRLIVSTKTEKQR